MNILLLAPHPFYQERGTPIAVDLVLQALSGLGHRVRVLTYHEGEERRYPGVTLDRIPAPPFVHDVPPGFSIRKLVCSSFLLVKALHTVRRDPPDAIHAVEDAVFIAGLCKRLYRVPYVYDMDSSMPDQIAESRPAFRFLLPLLRRFEAGAIRGAAGVAVVCDALAEIVRAHRQEGVHLLRDISLLGTGPDDPGATPLREELGLGRGVCFMYVGNLEPYQGLELLLDSFRLVHDRESPTRLVVVGGTAAHVEQYRRRAGSLGLSACVHFTGPRPSREMKHLFASADVLVSPRCRGENTPMKIYSYLDSGKPVVATDLKTHTQAMDGDVAVLAPPEPAAFARAMLALARDPERRRHLAGNARKLVRERYSMDAYRRTLEALYADLARAVGAS